MEYIITRRDVHDKADSLLCRSKTRRVFAVTGALGHARYCAQSLPVRMVASLGRSESYAMSVSSRT